MKKPKTEYDISKIVLLSIFLNITQIIFITLFLYYRDKNTSSFYGDYSVNAIVISIALNSIITGILFYNLLFKKGSKNLIDAMKDLEALNTTLRAQRHDYLNHIQVIYSLMELEEYKEARKYMEPVYKDIIKLSKALKTTKPAVNALLQAKYQVAEKNGIDMELEIKSDLAKLSMEPWEFCRILGNLIDNAFYVLAKKQDNRQMLVEFSEDLNAIIIRISNNGERIMEEHLTRIFQEGFTTKGTMGEGMGLSIVKDLVESFHGTVTVTSNEKRTSFEVCLPKK